MLLQPKAIIISYLWVKRQIHENGLWEALGDVACSLSHTDLCLVFCYSCLDPVLLSSGYKRHPGFRTLVFADFSAYNLFYSSVVWLITPTPLGLRVNVTFSLRFALFKNCNTTFQPSLFSFIFLSYTYHWLTYMY